MSFEFTFFVVHKVSDDINLIMSCINKKKLKTKSIFYSMKGLESWEVLNSRLCHLIDIMHDSFKNIFKFEFTWMHRNACIIEDSNDCLVLTSLKKCNKTFNILSSHYFSNNFHPWRIKFLSSNPRRMKL